MKRCKRCGVTKPLGDFYREKGCRDGHRPECKSCNLAARKVWYQANREREIARVKAWQQANPERVNASNQKSRAANPDRARDGYLRRTFGLSLAEYEEMLTAQHGTCAICGRPPRKGSSLHVDHDHETGAVRGLLCFRCNGGLGQFKEEFERLVTASEYLSGDLEPIRTRTLFRGMSVARARRLSSVSG